MAIILHADPGAFRLLPNLIPEIEVQKSLLTSTSHLVMRWGVEEGSDDHAVVLNRAQAIRNVAKAGEFFNTNGLSYTPNAVNFYRRYRYYMFELLPVRVLRKEIGEKKVQEVGWSSSKEARDAAVLAGRALHILGLDFGLVEIGVDSRGHLSIISVNPSPRLTRRLAEAYAEPIRRRLREAELRQTMPIFQKANPAYLDKIVSIGADPEFMLRDGRTRKMVMASRFFPKLGMVGCDARFVRGAVSGYPLAELRPEPSCSPLQLVENIKATMNKALRLAPYTNVQWRAGSMPFKGFPIGGHVHFVGVPLTGQFLRVLDNYVALPMMLLESRDTAKKRRTKYGHLGDFRIKGHGGFEYRTPASWLVHPEIAKAILCLAKLVACEYQMLKRDVFLSTAAQAAFISANKEYFQHYFTMIWEDIKRTTTFKLYENDLKIIEQMVTSGETWDERVDIRVTWNLPIPRGRVYRP